MISLSEVKLKAIRKNNDSNSRLHFFSSLFSIYFSWIFINLKLSPNAVTGIFFVTGLFSALLFLENELLYTVIAYILWRLHIIFDLCDGDVARFTKKFSINGVYWDYMIHSILYPLTYAAICFSLYTKFNNILFLILAIFGSIIVSQILAVKNNYYRAMLFDGRKLDLLQGAPKALNLKSFFISFFIGLLHFEGFLFCYLILSFGNFSSNVFLIFLLIYILSFLSQVLIKFLLFSKNGFYRRRS